MSWSSASSYDSQDSSSGYNSAASGSGASAAGVDALLQHEMMQLNQSMAIQQVLRDLASLCWDKCEVKSESALRSSDRDCIEKCTGRFLDTQQFVAMRLQTKLSQD